MGRARLEWSPVTLIALDLDGTLEDSRQDMVAAARRVREQLELPPRPDEELRPWVNAGMDRLYRACFGDYLERQPGSEAYARAQAAYEADYLAHIADTTRLYPGIANALSELAMLGKLACVTNKPEAISRRLLQALRVGAHFSAVVGGDTCEHAKPHPVMLETAAREAGFRRLRPTTCFMIGDTAADLRMGQAYGAFRVWCSWGYAQALDEMADAVAREPAELVQIVRSVLGSDGRRE